MPNLCESVSKLCISGRYIYIVQPAAWCPGSYLQHTYLLENKYYIYSEVKHLVFAILQND